MLNSPRFFYLTHRGEHRGGGIRQLLRIALCGRAGPSGGHTRTRSRSQMIRAWREARDSTFSISSFSSCCISSVSSNFVKLSSALSAHGYTKQKKNRPCKRTGRRAKHVNHSSAPNSRGRSSCSVGDSGTARGCPKQRGRCGWLTTTINKITKKLSTFNPAKALPVAP